MFFAHHVRTFDPNLFLSLPWCVFAFFLRAMTVGPCACVWWGVAGAGTTGFYRLILRRVSNARPRLAKSPGMRAQVNPFYAVGAPSHTNTPHPTFPDYRKYPSPHTHTTPFTFANNRRYPSPLLGGYGHPPPPSNGIAGNTPPSPFASRDALLSAREQRPIPLAPSNRLALPPTSGVSTGVTLPAEDSKKKRGRPPKPQAAKKRPGRPRKQQKPVAG